MTVALRAFDVVVFQKTAYDRLLIKKTLSMLYMKFKFVVISGKLGSRRKVKLRKNYSSWEKN
jgi:hypothetical protein